jgi:hypothetical protein
MMANNPARLICEPAGTAGFSFAGNDQAPELCERDGFGEWTGLD